MSQQGGEISFHAHLTSRYRPVGLPKNLSNQSSDVVEEVRGGEGGSSPVEAAAFGDVVARKHQSIRAMCLSTFLAAVGPNHCFIVAMSRCERTALAHQFPEELFTLLKWRAPMDIEVVVKHDQVANRENDFLRARGSLH